MKLQVYYIKIATGWSINVLQITYFSQIPAHHSTGSVWKHGIESFLPGAYIVFANAITVAAGAVYGRRCVVNIEKNVYVAGSIANPDGVQVAVYWKGARHNLS